VNQDGDVIDILVQRYRKALVAKRFFRKLMEGQGTAPWRLVREKLESYSARCREIMPP
jgi:putative transposase